MMKYALGRKCSNRIRIFKHTFMAHILYLLSIQTAVRLTCKHMQIHINPSSSYIKYLKFR